MPSSVKKYPGRDRVMAREDARDILWRASLAQRVVNPCLRPIEWHGIGLPGPHQPSAGKLPVTVLARCRKCAGCLKHRQRLWTARAVDEIAMSNRTWFGTLTVAPEHRFRLRMAAEMKCHRRRCEPLSSLPDAELFRYLAAELNSEATKFLKRVRAETKQPLRYLLVTEKHKSGDPHMHILVHEPLGEVRKMVLENQWKIGFSHWRLVKQDSRAAIYACKYLSKEALTRVRASLRYGQRNTVSSLTERLEAATRSINATK